MNSFKALNLSETMLSSLTRQGYLNMSPIQELTIPKALKGNNLVVRSETGSGKTHSFLIPIIDRIDFNLGLQAIILCPTRELAKQTFDFARRFTSDFKQLKVRLISSETSEKQNIEGLSIAPHIIVATPGRIVSLFNKNIISPKDVKCLVLDEADMLLDLGYFSEIDTLVNLLNQPQVMVFSATIEEKLRNEIIKYVGADYEVTSDGGRTSKGVTHYLVNTHHKSTIDAIKEFLRIKNPYFIIIFLSKKEDVRMIYGLLKKDKYNVCMISGDLSTRERKAVMKRINNDEYQIVVASDLAARGLDFANVSDIISCDLPSDLEYYHHRSGRTGRFDKVGSSYVFYDEDSNKKRIESLIDQGVEFIPLSLKNGELIPGKPFIKVHRPKKVDEELQKKIRLAKAQTKTNKVKPGYKKKVKVAISKAKQKHRREIIKQDIRRQRVERYKQESRDKNNG